VQNGDTRVCSLEGGGELTEKIVSVDHDLKRVVYAITSSPLNMDFHVATMQLEESGGKTQLNWIVDFPPIGDKPPAFSRSASANLLMIFSPEF